MRLSVSGLVRDRERGFVVDILHGDKVVGQVTERRGEMLAATTDGPKVMYERALEWIEANQRYYSLPVSAKSMFFGTHGEIFCVDEQGNCYLYQMNVEGHPDGWVPLVMETIPEVRTDATDTA